MFKKTIKAKTPVQVDTLRESGKYLTELLWLLYEMCKPGISTMELEVFAQKFLLSHNIVGAFKWYGWFPTNLCTSVNDCVVHGVPSAYILQPWDVLKVDCGVNYQWMISDAAFTIVIGWDEEHPLAASLIETTRMALDESIRIIKPWVVGKEFGKTVWNVVSSNGFQVLKNLTGHGVGLDVHEEPHIYNRPQNSMKKRSFVEGMVCALEPITAIKSTQYVEKQWIKHDLFTEFGDIGAQREYTVVVTNNGVEVLAWLQM
jgi:methionyl aminopeptidase